VRKEEEAEEHTTRVCTSFASRTLLACDAAAVVVVRFASRRACVNGMPVTRTHTTLPPRPLASGMAAEGVLRGG
jgi:hypothetical protein